MKSYLTKLLLTLGALAAAAPAFAVTDKEMEQAKAITAKEYLRYVNNGSGYLDELSTPTSMADLESNLKDKEKENLKDFKKVSVPSDYASWDKEQLVKYWSDTFLSSGALNSEGVKARTRVRNKINAMTIAPPAPAAAEETPEETPAGEAMNIPEELTNPAAANPAEAPLPADTVAAPAPAQEEAKSDNGSLTWLWITLLVVLVGIVVWLVLYAAKSMKQQNDDIRRLQGDDDEEDDHYSTRKPRAPEAAAADSEALREHQRKQAEDAREIERLSQENENLKLRMASMQAELSSMHTQVERIKAERDAAIAMKAQRPAQTAAPAPAAPKTTSIYLGRVNDQGVFVRADRKFTPGASLYRLETTDGVSGSFYLDENPEATDLALDNPEKMLMTGCIGYNLADAAGVNSISTITAGTAIFENGVWKVTRKARIRFNR